MRTALYVRQNTTITFAPTTLETPTPLIVRYPDESSGRPATGAVELSRGIYMIHSKHAVSPTGVGFDVEVSINDKDAWPDPPQQQIALEPGATLEKIRMFFTIAKDVEL